MDVQFFFLSLQPILMLMTVLLSGVRGGEKSSGEKIIIHVPYKIHSHLHTHTNYKLIKVPEEPIENLEAPGLKNEEEHYKKEFKIDSAIPSIKSAVHITTADTHFKPSHPFQSFKPGTSLNPIQLYPELKEVEKVENVPLIQHESKAEHLISLPTVVTPLIHKFKAPEPSYQLDEDKSYLHAYSTKTPTVPFYNSQISNPSYEVEEKEATGDKLIPKVIPYESVPTQSATSKSNAGAFARNYIQKNPYNIRTGKAVTTTNSFKIPPTTLYIAQGLKNIPTQTTKTIMVPTIKTPKSIFANGEDFEQIGYLVVGENSHKFMGVNNDNK